MNNFTYLMEIIIGKFAIPMTDLVLNEIDIQDYFECNIKKHESLIDKSPVQIHVNKIQNRIIFKIKTGYCIEVLTLRTTKLLTCKERRILKDKIVRMWRN